MQIKIENGVIEIVVPLTNKTLTYAQVNSFIDDISDIPQRVSFNFYNEVGETTFRWLCYSKSSMRMMEFANGFVNKLIQNGWFIGDKNEN